MSNTVEKMNLLVADSIVLFSKIHNYHWNLKGVQFYGVHLKTESFYEHIGTVYDDLAERILQLGSKPIVTLKKALEIARIQEEETTDFDAKYVMDMLLKDFEFLTKEFQALSEGADPVTAAYADEQVAFFQKEIWMMQSFLG